MKEGLVRLPGCATGGNSQLRGIYKRIVSSFFVFVLFLWLFPMSADAKSAQDYTADQAIGWCAAQEGKTLGNGQCVALIRSYYDYLTGDLSGIWGNACDYATNKLPAGFERIEGGTPQKGDILIYTGSQYGHVCIYENDYSTYHQNYTGQYVQHITRYYRDAKGRNDSYWGLIRPNFASGSIKYFEADGMYDPDDAAAYALKYWKNYNPAYTSYTNADCANFVSQCLYAGGMKKTVDWNPDAGTWKLVGDLVWLMHDICGKELIHMPNADQISVGDIMVYRWSGYTDYCHVAICVEVRDGVPYVCSHTNDLYTSDWKLGAEEYWVLKGQNVSAAFGSGMYIFESAKESGKGLAVVKGANGLSNVVISSEPQVFNLSFDGTAHCMILNEQSKMYLDLADAGMGLKTNVQATPKNEGAQWKNNRQWWGFLDAGDGYFYVVSKLSAMCLDVEDGNMADGTNVQMYTPLGNIHQKWRLIPYDGKVYFMSLDKTSWNMTVGDSGSLKATVAPADVENKNVNWSSSNTSVATVDGSGKVTAKAPGGATITATAADGSGKSASCTVTVRAKVVSVTGVSLNKATMTLTEGGSENLTATIAPSDATNKNVNWSSSNTSVATVDGSGKVTAKAPGSATITATAADGSGKSASCTVNVQAKIVSVTGVSLNKTTMTLTEGGSESLTATITPGDATNKGLLWASSNTSVATVDGNGKVTALAEGVAIITAAAADGSGAAASCIVNVTGAVVSGQQVVYRLYNGVNYEHLYTTDVNEVRVLATTGGWTYEGSAWVAPSSGAPVFRLNNRGLQNHLYTTDTNEVAVLTTQYGWELDNGGNPLFYSGGSQSIYRLYKEDLNGMHLLSTDLNEYNVLGTQHGWAQEGIKLNCLAIGDSAYPFP